MIVFGWNSFKIGECKPSSLGMSPEMDQQIALERRQKYFHLFWIPFFGIGKIWVLRKRNDAALYEIPAEIRAILESLPVTHNTPWYTYSLPLLVVVGGLLFSVYEVVDDHNRRESSEAFRLEENERLTRSIHAPEQGTYFQMDTPSERDAYLKVVGNETETLVCLFSMKKDPKYSEYEILEAFITDSVYTSFDTVRILKKDMLKTVNLTEAYPFEGFEIVKGAGNYVLEELKNYTSPVFKSLGAGYEEGEFFAAVQNIGEPAQFKEYTHETTNVEFPPAVFPKEVNQGDVIFLRGVYKEAEPKMRGKLKFESVAKSIIEYDFTILGSYLSFKQIDK
jgi:hypothetical protein